MTRSNLVRLPLRGQRRLGVLRRSRPSCFPFNHPDVNVGTGTNGRHSKRAPRGTTTIFCRPGLPPGLCPLHHTCAMSTLEDLADRVERLLLRHDELKRTNALLEQQLASVAAERDNLRSRLAAARARIDALIERLPVGEVDAHERHTLSGGGL